MPGGGTFSNPSRLVDNKPAKKLTPEEVKASADRLATAPKRENELPPLVEKRTLTKDGIDKSLDRLYTQSITRKQQQLETLDKKAHPDMVKHVQLDRDQLEGAFNRLCNQSMEQKKTNMAKLEEKYHAKVEGKKIDGEALKASANRLCNESCDHAREKHKKLFEKYVLETQPKYGKLTKEQLAASADRLCAKK